MPAVCREGDTLSTGHICDTSTVLATPGQTTVYADNILIARVTDPTVSHAFPPQPPCAPHVAYVNAGSPNVFVEFLAVARIGDSADAGAMQTGSPTVFANDGGGGGSGSSGGGGGDLPSPPGFNPPANSGTQEVPPEETIDDQNQGEEGEPTDSAEEDASTDPAEETTQEVQPTGELNQFQEERIQELSGQLSPEELQSVQQRIQSLREDGIDAYTFVDQNTGELMIGTNPLTDGNGNVINYTPSKGLAELGISGLRFPSQSEYDSLVQQADTYHATNTQPLPENEIITIGTPTGDTNVLLFQQANTNSGYSFNGGQGLTALGTKVYTTGGLIYGGSYTGNPSSPFIQTSPSNYHLGLSGNYADYSHGTVGVAGTGIYLNQ